jgi:xanthine dehydrogenase accessory factor
VSLQGEFTRVAQTGGRAALVTVIEGDDSLGAKLLVRADGTTSGGLGSADRDARAAEAAEELMWAERSEKRGELFVDVVAPPPRVFIFGAVDFAGALCGLANAVGWRPFIIDPRGRFATRERFPQAEDVVVAWPEKAVERLGGIDRATYIAILTHDPKLDDAALAVALAAEPAYIGAMGSRRAQEKRRERMVAAGFTDDDLARVSAPIGLDLGGLTAEETALSIMAECVAVRNGRSGGRLADVSGAGHRIHEVTSS